MTTRTAAGGFTLLEVILAVALVSIVTVAIASIFATVGETVTAGQRLSNVNRVAARVERVMRRDFDRMVRTEGFLVIANEITRYRSNEIAALDPVLVGLTPDDELPRPRRIDQIMFFARDDFATLRAPLDPALVARSDTARIYYGHGQRLPVDLGGADSPDNPIDDTTFLTPRVSLPITDPNLNAPATGVIGVDQSPLLQDSRLGVVAEQFDNPNQFATDWSLLRHVTLLSPPRPRLSDLPPTLVGFTLTAAQQSELLDSPRQIAAQPAQMSLFRSLAVTEPPLSQLADSGFAPFVRTIVGLGADLDGASGSTGVLARPTAQSGIVDIAATTLDDVDAIVRGPLDRSGNAIIPPLGINRSATLDSQLSLFGTGDFGAVVDGFRGTGVLATQAWMLDGLPSEVWSYQTRDPVSGRVEGSRIRYELSPTRTLGLSSDDNPQQRAASAYRLADQDMLSSFVFLPRCTEFIVEFSFGIIDNRE
ncbi:MAG: prepilin-type N-terminal cleavage/methylation domain-containing protein, partial [Planctomycetota bacterium]